MDSDREKAIEARAYQLWEETGHPHGMHEEHWRQAEQEIDEASAEPTADQAPDPAVEDRLGDNVTSPAQRDMTTKADIPKRKK